MSDFINEQSRDQLRQFAQKFGPHTIIPAVVTAINEENTITVEFADETTLDEVRLKSVVKDGDRVVMIPKIGTTVLIGKIRNSNESIVLAVDEVSEVLYEINGLTYSANDLGFLMKRGNDTLKAALINLIESLEVVVIYSGTNMNKVKLATAKQQINNLLRNA